MVFNIEYLVSNESSESIKDDSYMSKLLISNNLPNLSSMRYDESKVADWRIYWGFLAKNLMKEVTKHPLHELYKKNGFPQHSAHNETQVLPFFTQTPLHFDPFTDLMRRFVDDYFPLTGKFLREYVKSEGKHTLDQKTFDFYTFTMLSYYKAEVHNDILSLFLFGVAEYKYFRRYFLFEQIYDKINKHDFIEEMPLKEYKDMCVQILKPFSAIELYLNRQKTHEK